MSTKEQLQKGAAKLGVNISDQQLLLFEQYKRLLLAWNQRVNLTAITKEDEIISKHFLDSLSILPLFDGTEQYVVDIGVGAGFPSIPVKIIRPEIHFTLLDSLNKRILFLQETANSLHLERLALIHGRAEELGRQPAFRECFDLCLSRAVAYLPALVEYCLPFVKIGGKLISMKGRNIKQEVADAEKSISLLGGQISDIIQIDLPFTDIKHNLIVIRKLSQTPVQYPRKQIKIQKNPIL